MFRMNGYVQDERYAAGAGMRSRKPGLTVRNDTAAG